MPKRLTEAAIRKQIAALQQKLAKSSRARVAAVRAIAAQMKKHAISLEEVREALGAKVASVKAASRTRAKPKVKYRDDKGNTWTGRGVSPRWLLAAEKAGRKREEFLI